MAKGFNSVQLIGALTQDPELRYTAQGMAILEIPLAGNDLVIGDDGQEREVAWYHSVTFFAGYAEALADNLEQGMIAFVDASLNYRSWEDESGQKRSAVGLRGNRLETLGMGHRTEGDVVYDSRQQPRIKHALNRVTVIGNLTNDVELRYTSSGVAMLTGNMAINDSYRTKQGEDRESTHFIGFKAWRDLAETFQGLKKGAAVLIEGRFKTESWETQNGEKRYRQLIDMTRLEHLERRNKNTSQAAPTPSRPTPPPPPNLDIDEFPPEEDLPF
jgi:single-strand DNA-binding protein